jgi:RNA polymerase sigma-70 factor (ECF subfamily)
MLNETPSSEIEQRIESEWVRYVTDLALERIRKVFSGEAVAVFTMSLNEKPAKEIAEELNLTVDSVYTLKSRVKARFIREVKAVMNELEA